MARSCGEVIGTDVDRVVVGGETFKESVVGITVGACCGDGIFFFLGFEVLKSSLS